MGQEPEPAGLVERGPNDERIRVRTYGRIEPYYDFELDGETYQSSSLEEGVAIITKRAQCARLLVEMCASYGLVPDTSRNAGQMGSLKRDLVFGDLALTKSPKTKTASTMGDLHVWMIRGKPSSSYAR